jgi:hypothetical protein
VTTILHNPLLRVAFVLALMVIVCWSGAQIMRWAMERSRRREAERRGGTIDAIDFSRRRL